MQTCKSCSARIAQGMYCTDCERQMLNKTIDMNALGKMIYERLRPSSACNQQWNMWPDHWQKEYIEAASEITAHVRAERDRLAAENAELRKAVAETEQACSELSDELSQMHQLELEAKCHGDLEESHKIMVDVVAERDAELATANATLDALREAVPEDVTGWTTEEVVAAFFKAQHRIYPQPAERAKEKDNG